MGDAERAIELAGRLVAVNGLDEDSQELLIRAYSAAGDRAAAERQRDACIALFQSELGTDPGPAVMRAAEAQALRESTQRVPSRAAIEARLEAGLAAQDAGARPPCPWLSVGARSPRPGRRGRRNAAPGNQGR